MKNNKKYKEEDYQYMKDHYSDMTSTEIAKKIGCSRQLVLKVWMNSGLKGKEKSRTYYFNFNYFKKIDCPNKAYIIGLIASDGTLYSRKEHQGQIRLCLKEKDKQILEDIKKEIEYKQDLYYFKETCALTLNSETMYQDLLNVGLFNRKTYIINLNNLKIPSEYIFDFIRGYFDGDGCIQKHKQTTCKNITPCCYNIDISGFTHNLRSIQDFLLKKGIRSQITIDKRKEKYRYPLPFGRISLGSIKDKYFFIKEMYAHEGLTLKRKQDLCFEFLEKVESNPSKYDFI